MKRVVGTAVLAISAILLLKLFIDDFREWKEWRSHFRQEADVSTISKEEAEMLRAAVRHSHPFSFQEEPNFCLLPLTMRAHDAKQAMNYRIKDYNEQISSIMKPGVEVPLVEPIRVKQYRRVKLPSRELGVFKAGNGLNIHVAQNEDPGSCSELMIASTPIIEGNRALVYIAAECFGELIFLSKQEQSSSGNGYSWSAERSLSSRCPFVL